MALRKLSYLIPKQVKAAKQESEASRRAMNRGGKEERKAKEAF